MLEHLKKDPESPKRVVVVGAAGFVGGALVKRLRGYGFPVLALSRAEIDLLAPDAAGTLAACLEPDDCVVLASAIAPCKNVWMLADNMLIVRALVEALQISPVGHVVNISSDAVYSDSPTALTEMSDTQPENLHGVMHYAREIALHAENDSPIAVLRPSLLYGYNDPHNGYGPNRFRRLANAGEDIVLFGEGEERRDHVLIDDFAEIITRVICRRSVGTLNIATGRVYSFREVAEMVVEAAPIQVPIRGSERVGPMPHNGYRPFDISACHAAFPEFEYTPLAEGVRLAQAGESRNG